MTPEPRPIALGDNVVYALPLDAGGWLLVDAGPDFDGSWEEMEAQARAHGFDPREVRTVLITHAHLDHAGLAHRWVQEGARVLAGAADRPRIEAAGPRGESTRNARREELVRHGCPPEVLTHVTRPRGIGRMRWQAPPPGSIDAVADGTTFDLAGGATLRVIAAPGHTPGNLVAFVEPAGILCSGDTLLPTTIPTPGLHFPDGPDGPRWPSLPPFLDAIRRLRELPVRRVLPGHGEPVDEPQRLFDRFQAHHERRARRIRAVLTEGPESAYGIARRLFPHLPAARVGQAMTEVIGHLDVLLAAGEAVLSMDERGVAMCRLSTGEARGE